MAYSTPDDVRSVLAPGDWPQESAPVTHTAADLDNDQLSKQIAQADQLIDSYINRYYTTPVVGDPAPEPVATWSANLAAYLATLTWRKGKDLSPNDPVALRYAQTMQALTGVNRGNLGLNLPTNGGDSGGAGAAAPINSYSGDLFDAGDFNLAPINPGWPYLPDIPSPFPGRW